MSIKHSILLLGLLLAGTCSTLTAQETVEQPAPLRPVTAFYTLEAGSAHITDTYLTPIRYSGWTLGFGYDRWQAMKFDPGRWSMNLWMNLHIDRTENSPGNAAMWDLGLAFSWGMYRKWTLPVAGGLNVGAGGRLRADLGCLYLSRNGNNPASAKASATLDASVYAAKRIKVFGKLLDLRYITSVPVIGAFFSPDYGELYYEIWLGNYKGLAHCAWWDRYFRWDNDVTADLHLGNTILTFGYRCNLLSTKINHINTRMVSHSFVFGLGGEWISLSPGKKLSADAKIISAIY